MSAKWPKLGLWFAYPFSTLIPFMEGTEFRIFGNVLVLGPLAFAIIWRRPLAPHTDWEAVARDMLDTAVAISEHTTDDPLAVVPTVRWWDSVAAHTTKVAP